MSQKNITLPADTAALLPVDVLRQRLSLNILRVLASVGILVLITATYDSIADAQIWTLPLYWGTYGTVVFLAFWHGGTHRVRSWVLIGLFYIGACTDFVENGPGGSGRVFMAMLPFLGSLLLNRTVGWFTLGLSVITMGTFGGLFARGVLSISGYVGARDFLHWFIGAMVLLLSGALTTVALDYFVRQLGVSLSQSQQLAHDLETERAGLEQTVLERTEELAQHARYLEATSEISRRAASLLDNPDEMLAQVIDLIGERFDFYNVSLFLVEGAGGEWVEMRAASSAAGKRILARGYRLRVGADVGTSGGIIGYVVEHGEQHIVRDVHTDALYQRSEELPDTRSEMALPLRVRGAVIGVLDVQSTSPSMFAPEDIVVLQSLADEVAVAVSNAQLFIQLQASIAAERQARGELSREAWGRQLAQAEVGFVKEAGVIVSAAHIWEPQMQQVVQTGKPVTLADAKATLAIPIKSGEQVIAVLDAQLPDGVERWSPEQATLLESLSEQLGQALDRARLYQETQNSAAREHTVGVVTARMREPLELEDVLMTAAEQIRQALNLEEFVVHLSTGVDVGNDGTNGAALSTQGDAR